MHYLTELPNVKIRVKMQNNQKMIALNKQSTYSICSTQCSMYCILNIATVYIITDRECHYRLQQANTFYSSPDKTIDGLTVHQHSIQHTSNAKAEVNWCHCCGMTGINHLLQNGEEESQCFVNMTQKGQVATVGEGKLLGVRNR